SNLGAGNYIVSLGEVEGWVWGDGRTPPPLIPFEQICAAPATATFTNTPLPTSTFTLTPLPTSTFTLTPLPLATTASSTNPSPTPRMPTSNPVSLPTSSPTPIPPTPTSALQAPLRTPTLTPSPTITLPFGVLLAATTVAPAQNPPQSLAEPPTEVALDLQAISLTATAAEAARQPEPPHGEGQQPEGMSQIGFGIPALDIVYFVFFAIVGGLLIILIVLVRRRGGA
ncbi:MAG: hypothetical protein N3D16_12435, partial [Anaerolineales bacterium]|nr:hypothetical protein [Anaerolineales bacterium]